MPEKEKITEEPNEDVKEPQAAAEPIKTETEGLMIPKGRFDEINDKYKDAMKQIEATKKALQKAQDDRLKEQENYKELYEKATSRLSELEPKAEQLDAYQDTLEKVLEAQVEEIPEELRALIPDEMTVQQRLGWISKNKALLTKPVGPDIGAGQRGAGTGGTIKLTPEEQNIARLFGYTDEEYEKYKDEPA